MAPVFFRLLGQSTRRQRAKNISAGGVQVYSDERLEVGQALELEFYPPNGVPIKAGAKVVWTKRLPPGSQGVYDVGVEFVNLSKAALKELDAILIKPNLPTHV